MFLTKFVHFTAKIKYVQTVTKQVFAFKWVLLQTAVTKKLLALKIKVFSLYFIKHKYKVWAVSDNICLFLSENKIGTSSTIQVFAYIWGILH